MRAATLIGYWRLLEDTPHRNEGLRLGPPPTQKQLDEWQAQALAESSKWPDPRRFLDPTWASSERRLVTDFLERCTRVNQYRGLSECRFCGQMNGSAEMTDGVYCWPEGLAHYVHEHEVRLPDEFVMHVHDAEKPLDRAPRPSFDKLGQRDPSWPGSEFGSPIWKPEDPVEEVTSDGFWVLGLTLRGG